MNDDLISRQAAIDAMRVINDSICEQQAIDALWELPSAQPEILACGEGELNVPCINIGDLISKQAAIDAIEREKSLIERPITETRWFDLGLGKAQDVLSELPSAQPERKRGKWIYREAYRGARFGFMECSCCGESVWFRKEGPDKYCRNCGAEMEVEN